MSALSKGDEKRFLLFGAVLLVAAIIVPPEFSGFLLLWSFGAFLIYGFNWFVHKRNMEVRT